mgnify:CR=1 FL=1
MQVVQVQLGREHRALGALHVCAEKLRRRNVFLARSVATEACPVGLGWVRVVDSDRDAEALLLVTGEEPRLMDLRGRHIAQLGDPALYEAQHAARCGELTKRREVLPDELAAMYARAAIVAGEESAGRDGLDSAESMIDSVAIPRKTQVLVVLALGCGWNFQLEISSNQLEINQKSINQLKSN